jgi:hypothetical protein
MSKLRISHEELQASFPNTVASLAKIVNETLESQGKPTVAPGEMTWTCSYEPDYASNDLQPQLERLGFSAEFGPVRTPYTHNVKSTMPRYEDLPATLQKALNLEVYGARRHNLENCGVITHVRKPYETSEYLILGGLEMPDGDTRLAMTKVGWPVYPSEDGSLGITPVWARVSETAFEKRYDATSGDLHSFLRAQPGEEFQWGGKTVRKMQPEDLQMRFDGKTIDDSLETELDRAVRQDITPTSH